MKKILLFSLMIVLLSVPVYGQRRGSWRQANQDWITFKDKAYAGGVPLAGLGRTYVDGKNIYFIDEDGTVSSMIAGAAGGDSISINGVAVVDPDFVSTGQVSFTDTSNTVTADITDDSIVEADINSTNGPTDNFVLSYNAAGSNFTWAADAGGAETNSLETTITGNLDTEIFVGNGADSGTFVSLSGAIALSNAGVVTINPNVVDGTHIAIGGDAQGDVLQYDGTDYVVIPLGTMGQQLTVNEAATSLEYGLASKYINARNTSGSTITKGSPVYISGWNAGQAAIEITLADADSAATMPAVGIVYEDISNNSNGRILLSGNSVAIVDTSGFSVGDAAYVSGTAGTLTNTKPTGTALIQKIGTVGRVHATLGQLTVVGAGRSNDLPNLANTKLWIGDASGVPQEFTLSGDVTNTAGGAVTIANNAVALTTDTTGNYSTGNAEGGDALVSIAVEITDNESTAEENPLVFVAGADPDGGDLPLETDGTCTYNPSTGEITTTGFVGALTGNADTVTTNANLTGHVTSTGNAAILGSFTVAQLNTAVSDETIAGSATTNTFTNKTYDANGTGNVLSNIDEGNCLAASDLLRSGINFIIDGGGSAITTGVKGYVEIPFGCTIQRVTMLSDTSTTTVVDIWVDTYANYPPIDADSITASAVPTITTAVKSQDTTLTGWTTALTAGSIIGYNVDSNDNSTKLTISLIVEK